MFIICMTNHVKGRTLAIYLEKPCYLLKQDIHVTHQCLHVVPAHNRVYTLNIQLSTCMYNYLNLQGFMCVYMHTNDWY